MRIKVRDADHLNQVIIKKGFSKIDFSKEIKLSQPMTIQITNGSRNPSPKTAKRICDILELSFEELFIIERTKQATVK
ncbi:MAG: helix-turn-helix transcriptional regulator [Gorillibacterium sp.]|nr:helix-turn-helix transcriptional regulator [Gorillibacterium sp.]